MFWLGVLTGLAVPGCVVIVLLIIRLSRSFTPIVEEKESVEKEAESLMTTDSQSPPVADAENISDHEDGEIKCPACNTSLISLETGTIRADICNSCGGIWFDRFELMKANRCEHAEVEALLNVKIDADAVVELKDRINCPKCLKIVMMRHLFNADTEVEVDECPGCAGHWLDAGKFKKIRTAEEKRQVNGIKTLSFRAEQIPGQNGDLSVEQDDKMALASLYLSGFANPAKESGRHRKKGRGLKVVVWGIFLGLCLPLGLILTSPSSSERLTEYQKMLFIFVILLMLIFFLIRYFMNRRMRKKHSNSLDQDQKHEILSRMILDSVEKDDGEQKMNND
ncbi:zf-TFIIB domain-containing protein [Desulfobacterales bacterium HSG16]|nr:zf-TFIIB domain-containing protein [Desulfobacterales bacterium HSG16]